MRFAGVDPGSGTYAIATVDELGEVIDYFEVPTNVVEKDALRLVKYVEDERPYLVAIPSGHGLPLLSTRELTEKEFGLLALADPWGAGHLRSFLRAAKMLNGFTVPGVVELESVPEARKVNKLDMGTADKVASAFFYRTMMENFVLLEVGTKFTSLIVVKDGVIIDGYGGTLLPGPSSPGALDGEIAYLLCRFSRITKETIYEGGNSDLTVALALAEYYSRKLDVPIVVSGKRKWEVPVGVKMEFKFKEAAVGAALIANAVGGG
ncbi:acetate kinase [Sulfodiicoccus acidiphilus]|nr:acetate kinase [Sulfodiicoccus acidiphilus]